MTNLLLLWCRARPCARNFGALCTLVHFGAVVADAPSPLSTPRSAAGQAQLRLGKPLRKKCRASPDAFRHAGGVVAGSVGIVRATVPFSRGARRAGADQG